MKTMFLIPFHLLHSSHYYEPSSPQQPPVMNCEWAFPACMGIHLHLDWRCRAGSAALKQGKREVDAPLSVSRGSFLCLVFSDLSELPEIILLHPVEVTSKQQKVYFEKKKKKVYFPVSLVEKGGRNTS